LDGWRHSPLGQITSENVSGLKLLWAHQFKTTGNTPFESTPIVANKTIFVTEPPSNVFALDAVDGHEIWQYVRRLPEGIRTCCGTVNRGLAILGNNLYLGTLDGSLVAIDATTGQLKWETRVADPREGFAITSAPLVVKSTVIIGVTGGEFGIRGFLAAYDANTGNQLWRFDTIPGPGAFGHDSWENDAWKSGGGPTWVTGSYDPKLNLLYWGVGNPSPEYNAEVRPGDNLFTDSAIALDATTGKLAWHFQFTPHDAHDWDSSQTPVLADLTIDGTPRRLSAGQIEMVSITCWIGRMANFCAAFLLLRSTGPAVLMRRAGRF
jgi:alcohol dehydrogenase (cytochrome c)